MVSNSAVLTQKLGEKRIVQQMSGDHNGIFAPAVRHHK